MIFLFPENALSGGLAGCFSRGCFAGNTFNILPVENLISSELLPWACSGKKVLR